MQLQKKAIIEGTPFDYDGQNINVQFPTYDTNIPEVPASQRTFHEKEYRKAMRDYLLSGAAAIAGAALIGYGLTKGTPAAKEMMDADKLYKFDKLRMALGGTTLGGALYAYYNRDNPKKRILGALAGAASFAGYAARANQTAAKDFPLIATNNVNNSALKDALPVGLGLMMITLGSLGAAHNASKIDSMRTIDHILNSDLHPSVVADTINRIKGRKTLTTRYPFTKYLPKNTRDLIEKYLFNEHDYKFKSEDYEKYYKAQVNKMYNMLLRTHGAQGNVDDRLKQELMNKAKEIVDLKLGIKGVAPNA